MQWAQFQPHSLRRFYGFWSASRSSVCRWPSSSRFSTTKKKIRKFRSKRFSCSSVYLSFCQFRGSEEKLSTKGINTTKNISHLSDNDSLFLSLQIVCLCLCFCPYKITCLNSTWKRCFLVIKCFKKCWLNQKDGLACIFFSNHFKNLSQNLLKNIKHPFPTPRVRASTCLTLLSWK